MRPVRFLPPSEARTGPASPGRSVCAPGAMPLSLYRRPRLAWRLTMRLYNLFGRWLRRPTPSPRRRGLRLRLEQLEDRTVPSAFTAASVAELIDDINTANQNLEAD